MGETPAAARRRVTSPGTASFPRAALAAAARGRRAVSFAATVLAAATAVHAALPAAPAAAAAQEAPSPSDLAREQEVARRRLENLLRKMHRVHKNLQEEGNTYGATLLQRGLEYVESREDDPTPLIDRMAEIVEDLDSARTYQALQKQQAMSSALHSLVDILLDREGLSTTDEKLQALARAKRQVGDLRDTQAKLLRETRERLTADPQTLQQLAEKVGQLEKAQQSLSEDLEATPADPASIRAATNSLLARELAAEARAAARDALQKAAQALQPALDEDAAKQSGGETASPASEDAANPPGQERPSGEATKDAKGTRSARKAALAKAVREARAATDEAIQTLEAAAAREATEGRDAAKDREAAEGRDAAKDDSAEEMLREARDSLGSLEDAAALLEEAIRRPERDKARDAAMQEARRMAEEAQSRLQQSDSYAQSEAEGTAQRELAQQASALAEESRRAGVPDEASRSLYEASRAAEQAAKTFLRGEASSARPEIHRAAEHLAEARDRLGAKGEQGEQRHTARLTQDALADQLQRLRRKTDRPEMVGGEEPLRRLKRELEDAEKSMRAASRSLGSGLRRRAASQGRDAAKGLARAGEQLVQGARRAGQNRGQAAETFRKLRLRQEQLEKKTRDLARKLESELGPSSAGSLQRAGSSMEEAGVQLGREEASHAQDAEEEAVQYLERAREQLDHQEERYRSLRQEELLFRLREELVDLRRGQKEVLAGTVEVDGAREDPGEAPSRSGRRRLEHLASQETALAGKVGEVLPKVQQEGAQVYAWLLEVTGSDMKEAARLLDAPEYRSGILVQNLIEATIGRLDELIQGLSKELDRRRSSPPPTPERGMQRQGKPPLVPDVAELKVLRYMEEEIYARTAALGEEDLSDELVPSRLQRLAHRQSKVTELYKAFKERVLRSQR